MDSSLERESSGKRSKNRQRKNTNPSRYVAPASVNASESTDSAKTKDKIYCKNMACQATMRHGDLFCKMCSCFICYNYDENKDPSRWLTCNSDPPFIGESCGLSCHLDCVFKSEKSGLNEDSPINDADGCFYCVSCSKRNSLLECWKKQLMIANETRKVDELCYCLVLAQKLLKGTKKYTRLSETVEKAVKSLETELCGPLTGLPSVICRETVHRLSCAQEVKDHCSSALKLLEDTPLDDLALPSKMQGLTKIRHEDVHATQEEEEANFVDCLGTKEEEEKELTIKEIVPETAVIGENSANGGFELEHCVKIIRNLEVSGHIKKHFRQKFLTWYTLRATAHEVNVVKTFIDVFKEDSVALAGQLVDTFSECISRKQSAFEGGDVGGVSGASSGFWMKSEN